jgi:hypothetical protein
MDDKKATTDLGAGRQIPPRRNDANETPDGLDANNEALRNAVENTPAETSTVDIELTSVFDRAYCAPKI